jgi:hypothetical protein
MRRAPPQVCLRSITFGADAFQNLALTHVEKLDLNVRVGGFEASNRLF